MTTNLLLQAVYESFIDGILVVSDRAEILFANRTATQICRALSPEEAASTQVPPQVWRICQTLIDNQAFYNDELVIIDDYIETPHSSPIRVRVRWLKLDSVNRPCLHVTLEDRLQLAKQRAVAERQRYGFTERETEVWLLRQVGCKYKAIAEQLHITVDTVKKHTRSINAKREAFQWAQGDL